MEKKDITFEDAVQTNRKLFRELTEKQQTIIRCCTVLCPTQGVSLRAMQQLLHVEWKETQPLYETKWIERAYDTVHIAPCVAAAVEREGLTLPIETVNHLLKRLTKHTTPTPFDDLTAKQPYFVMAFALLLHVMQHEEAYPEGEVDYYDFAMLASNVAGEEDLTWRGTTREEVGDVTDRRMNKILNFVLLKLNIYSPHLAWLSLRLATIYNQVFYYPQAFAELRLASHNALYWSDKHLLSEIKMAYAEVYHNQGLLALALTELMEAYCINKEEGCDDRNIGVALRMAFECAVSGLHHSARKWLNEAVWLTGHHQLPRHSRLHIYRLLVEALLYPLHEAQYALATITEAQSVAQETYGEGASVYCDIFFVRYLVQLIAEREEEGCRSYAQYVRMTRTCYGESAGGDLSNLYCAEIDMYTDQGAIEMAVQVCRELQVRPWDDIFPPGVRLYRYMTIAQVCTYLTNEWEHASENIDKAMSVIEQEIKPTVTYAEDRLKEILAPEDLEEDAIAILSEEYSMEKLMQMRCHIAVQEGNAADAVSICEEAISKSVSPNTRLSMRLTLGALNANSGNTDVALGIWNKIIAEEPSYAQVVAQMANDSDMLAEAKVYAEETDASDVYGLLLRAKIYEGLGLREHSSELFHRALGKASTGMQRISIYQAMASYRSSAEAERPLRKALLLAEREREASDELRSYLYHDLAEALGEQGRYDEAREAARKAVSLYPTECSDDFLEDIEPYL